MLQSVPTPQRPWCAAAAEARGYEGKDGWDQPSVCKGLIAGLAAVWLGYLPVPFGEGYEESMSYGEPFVAALLSALTG